MLKARQDNCCQTVDFNQTYKLLNQAFNQHCPPGVSIHAKAIYILKRSALDSLTKYQSNKVLKLHLAHLLQQVRKCLLMYVAASSRGCSTCSVCCYSLEGAQI